MKKLIIFAMVFSLIGFAFENSAQAGFFKRQKLVKKQATEESEVKEEKKILVVEIFASWCPGCKNIQPTLDQLVKEVLEIELVQLDVSTPSKSNISAKQAKDYNVSEFYRANKSKTSSVAVVVRRTGEIVTLFENNNKIEDYKTAIEDAKTKDKALDNPPA